MVNLKAQNANGKDKAPEASIMFVLQVLIKIENLK